MNWFEEIDAYCERIGPGYWAEPVNALTNLAFLIAAVVMWRRSEGVRTGRVLSAILFAIGVGSYLWHTHAQGWAGASDVLPILMFILVYIYAIHRDVWGLRQGPALILTGLFVPYAAVLVPVFARVPGLGDSAGYAPVPLLILIHAALLSGRAPKTARRLAIGGALLILSIGFRSLDGPICAALPLGTHFMWHVLNAVMLAWMIETYCRHIRSV